MHSSTLLDLTVFCSGYIDSLNRENVTAVTSNVANFNKDGIVTADGG